MATGWDLVIAGAGPAGTVRRSTPEHWGLSDAAGARDTVVARREVRRIDVEAAAKAVEKGTLPNRLRLDRTAQPSGITASAFKPGEEPCSLTMR